MVIKKALLATLAVSGFMWGSVVYADSQTVAVGYAQSKVQDFKNIRGVNFHYRYEWDSPLTIMGSFTYMKGDKKGSYSVNNQSWQAKADAKYYSLLVGPAYRIDSQVSVYALLGFSHTKIDVTENEYAEINGRSIHSFWNINKKATNIAYGAGVEVNPIRNLSFYAGYEGSAAKFNGKNHGINGFNIGVGYRF
ncbi:outer membrane beta-barrel protein [Xenorhabdus sp. DI]|uniref:Ail/Lom family outer membrane beta-barrel protein n=1 Tax=Xenorhabdus doucetiae TaxID=351671 RepID=UPI0019867CD1|nr:MULTISPECIES: Ail/Lom family outer membrane beta-barrel protein [unclassified Xenorhabdus]MBD2786377.1 outer membrane beta-barrel protein [Xenorhabdus sp. 3]MBD2789645.1 outer membrane beta-barrel protein [Xenorhabdus sp. DI]